MFASKRLLIAAFAGVTVFGTVFAAAASLDVGASTLGTGTSNVASCDSDGVTTSYDVAYNAAVGGYRVTTVTVTGIASPSCNGKAMRVSLLGSSDALLAEQTVTVGASATSASLTFTPDNVAASSVVKVAVVIAG